MGEPTPYELDPEKPKPPEPAKAEAPEAKIEAEGLLEGFEEDADFTRDPELEAKGPIPAEAAAERDLAEAEKHAKAFVRPGFPETQVAAVTGLVLLASALVATAINADAKKIASVFLAIYEAGVMAGLGVVAVAVAARLSERELGRYDLAGARMLVAVSAFQLVYSLRIDWIRANKIEEIVLGAAVYVLFVWSSFRWDRQSLGIVTGVHFLLWMLFRVGMVLSAYVAASSVPHG